MEHADSICLSLVSNRKLELLSSAHKLWTADSNWLATFSHPQEFPLFPHHADHPLVEDLANPSFAWICTYELKGTQIQEDLKQRYSSKFMQIQDTSKWMQVVFSGTESNAQMHSIVRVAKAFPHISIKGPWMLFCLSCSITTQMVCPENWTQDWRLWVINIRWIFCPLSFVLRCTHFATSPTPEESSANSCKAATR